LFIVSVAREYEPEQSRDVELRRVTLKELM